MRHNFYKFYGVPKMLLVVIKTHKLIKKNNNNIYSTKYKIKSKKLYNIYIFLNISINIKSIWSQIDKLCFNECVNNIINIYL